MENFVLSCCSTADLSLEHFQNRNIHYICFHYELNGTVYPDDLGQSMPFDVFYEAMTRGAETKTFQVNVAEGRKGYSAPLPFLRHYGCDEFCEYRKGYSCGKISRTVNLYCGFLGGILRLRASDG